LAGIPDVVVARARTVLDGLEQDRRGGNGHLAENPVQLTFVNGNGDLDTAVRNLKVEALTPLEAITRLFELKKMAKP